MKDRKTRAATLAAATPATLAEIIKDLHRGRCLGASGRRAARLMEELVSKVGEAEARRLTNNYSDKKTMKDIIKNHLKATGKNAIVDSGKSCDDFSYNYPTDVAGVLSDLLDACGAGIQDDDGMRVYAIRKDGVDFHLASDGHKVKYLTVSIV